MHDLELVLESLDFPFLLLQSNFQVSLLLPQLLYELFGVLDLVASLLHRHHFLVGAPDGRSKEIIVRYHAVLSYLATLPFHIAWSLGRVRCVELGRTKLHTIGVSRRLA